MNSNLNELKVETVREEDDVQIYKIEGEGIEVTFTNSTKTDRLYIDGLGSRKHKERIIDAVIKHTGNVKLGKPSRVGLPVMITIRNNNEETLIKAEDYIDIKLNELIELGYGNIKEKDLKEQLLLVLNNQNEELNEIGLKIKQDVIVE